MKKDVFQDLTTLFMADVGQRHDHKALSLVLQRGRLGAQVEGLQPLLAQSRQPALADRADTGQAGEGGENRATGFTGLGAPATVRGLPSVFAIEQVTDPPPDAVCHIGQATEVKQSAIGVNNPPLAVEHQQYSRQSIEQLPCQCPIGKIGLLAPGVVRRHRNGVGLGKGRGHGHLPPKKCFIRFHSPRAPAVRG